MDSLFYLLFIDEFIVSSGITLQSIASSLALQANIPGEDIANMSDWSLPTTFENCYQRDHLSCFKFANILITPSFKIDIDIHLDDYTDVYFKSLD
ncbi:hypothetical protein A0J61_01109 [Choanephora cucurbitarum]|uniref:Uncharacterized protein n=1 Tax=Choanephora cucurbitarum TaxID=101091 RepID=A0A1C7NTM0_9FUNG|nr:hypothetical protein A0J61_01109 [Choanephora cucurbitarum]